MITPRLWLHRETKTPSERSATRTIVARQIKAALSGTPPACAVCTRPAPSWLYSYRCRFCGIWLCAACSTVHFSPSEVPTDAA